MLDKYRVDDYTFPPVTRRWNDLMLDITAREAQCGVVLIAAHGELDLQTTPLLTRAFRTYRHRRLVLDMAPVSFCGVAGARALHTVSLAEEHVALAASRAVRRVLELTGLGSSLRQYQAAPDAIRAVLPAS